jgi:hypothetical protein
MWLGCLRNVTHWVAFILDNVGGVGAVNDDAFGDEVVECGNERFGGYVFHGWKFGLLKVRVFCYHMMLRSVKYEVRLLV